MPHEADEEGGSDKFPENTKGEEMVTEKKIIAVEEDAQTPDRLTQVMWAKLPNPREQ